jgi:hypothetical protein
MENQRLQQPKMEVKEAKEAKEAKNAEPKAKQILKKRKNTNLEQANAEPKAEPKDALWMCQMCFDDLPHNIEPISCSKTPPHKFCSECLLQHQKTREDNKVLEACPCYQCPGVFNLPSMVAQMGHKFISDYDFRLSASRTVNSQCPKCCKAFFHEDLGKAGVGHCVDGCKHVFCLKCMQPVHPGDLCSPLEKKDHFLLSEDKEMRENGFSKCENCCDRFGSDKVPFVKVESGCNLLVCKTCNHEFCAICCADLHGWCDEAGDKDPHDHISCPANGNAAKCKKPNCTHCPFQGLRQNAGKNFLNF